MKEFKDIIWYSLLIVLSFFATIFISCPLIKEIWSILVQPHYNKSLESGVIIFVLLFSTVLKHSLNTNETQSSPSTCFSRIVGFYMTLGITYLLAICYSWFI